MKTYLVLLTATLALFVAGCGTLVKGDPKPVVVTQPIYSVDQSTGLLTQTGTTNIDMLATQYALSPKLSNSLAAAQAVIAAGAAIPSPAAPVFSGLSIGLTALTALLGLYAKRKSGELTSSNAALAATVTVIEAAENAAALKSAVQKSAMANGSEDYLNDKVKNL